MRCADDSDLEAVLARLPILESPSNPNGDGCSPFALVAREREAEGIDESFLRANPRNGLNGRDGSFRGAKICKRCCFVAGTKMEYWEHMRGHVKGFACPECSFVTKYKHHMNHHWLSVHDGSKPFECQKCSYACVSKSMLTSHLKKHSNVYPYRCADCTYKTKFCNALKKHLRWKEHRPAMVLNPDGSPNPSSVIDVYGTKRGPKRKLSAEEREEERVSTVANDRLDSRPTISPLSSLRSPPIARCLTSVTAISGANDGHWPNRNGTSDDRSVAMFPYSDLVAAFDLSSHVSLREDAMFCESVSRKTDRARSDVSRERAKISNAEDRMPMEMFTRSLPVTRFDATDVDVGERPSSDSGAAKATGESSTTFVTVRTTRLEYPRTESADVPLDLRVAEVIGRNRLRFRTLARIGTNSPRVTDTSERKGKAIELERRVARGDAYERSERNEGVSLESPSDDGAGIREVNRKVNDTTRDEALVTDLFDAELTCHYCEIIFGNVIMYAVHMGCHSFDDPYACDICGQRYFDKLSFFLHIARSEH